MLSPCFLSIIFILIFVCLRPKFQSVICLIDMSNPDPRSMLHSGKTKTLTFLIVACWNPCTVVRHIISSLLKQTINISYVRHWSKHSNWMIERGGFVFHVASIIQWLQIFALPLSTNDLVILDLLGLSFASWRVVIKMSWGIRVSLLCLFGFWFQ